MKKYMPLPQLVRIFIALFGMVLIITLSVYMLNYYQRMDRERRAYIGQALDESARLLESKIDDTVLIVQRIIQNGGGSEFCTASHAWRNENQDYIRSQLSYLTMESAIFGEAIIFSQDRVYCSDNDLGGINPYVLYDALDEELALKVPFRQVKYHVISSATTPVVNIVVPIWTQNARSQLRSYCGVCIVQMKMADLLGQINVTGRPLMLQLDDERFASSDSSRIRQIDGFEAGNRMNAELKNYGWKLFAAGEETNISDDMRRMIQFTAAAGVLMLAMHIAFVWLFSNMVVRPIQRLANTVSQSTTNSIALDEAIDGRNELVMLTESFNGLLERVRRDNEEEIRRLRERAVFMQARINPHFLYNNLECIRGMAAMKCYDDILSMTGVMADIYRYCNHSSPIVTFKEELDCARNYVELLSLRYPERLTLNVCATEEVLQRRLPRMCLQPLLENSIYHGILAEGQEKGSLSINGWISPQGWYVTVDDDGCGMSKEELERVNSGYQQDENAVKHLGVSNVRNRLKMLFGEESELRYTAREQRGTRALIFIPNEQKKQNMLNKRQD